MCFKRYSVQNANELSSFFSKFFINLYFNSLSLCYYIVTGNVMNAPRIYSTPWGRKLHVIFAVSLSKRFTQK